MIVLKKVQELRETESKRLSDAKLLNDHITEIVTRHIPRSEFKLRLEHVISDGIKSSTLDNEISINTTTLFIYYTGISKYLQYMDNYTKINNMHEDVARTAQQNLQTTFERIATSPDMLMVYEDVITDIFQDVPGTISVSYDKDHSYQVGLLTMIINPMGEDKCIIERFIKE